MASAILVAAPIYTILYHLARVVVTGGLQIDHRQASWIKPVTTSSFENLIVKRKNLLGMSRHGFREGQAVLTSLRRSGWRSNSLNSLTKAKGGLVLPFS